MKRTILTAIVLIPLFTSAQFSKGDKFIGGIISFYSQNAPDSQTGLNELRTFSLTPAMGILLNHNFALGAQLGYSSSYNKITSVPSFPSEFNSRTFSLGIFGQRYFELSDRFLFTLHGKFDYAKGFNSQKYYDPLAGEYSEVETKNYQLTASISPIFIFFPSSNWGIEAGIGNIYYKILRGISTDEKTNFFSLDYGTITFGLSYYWRRSTNN